MNIYSYIKRLSMYVYIYIYIHIHTYTHIYTYIYTYIHTHTYIHTYIHTHKHTYIHTYIHTYLNFKTANIYYSNFLYFVNISSKNSIQFHSVPFNSVHNTFIYMQQPQQNKFQIQNSTGTIFINFLQHSWQTYCLCCKWRTEKQRSRKYLVTSMTKQTCLQ